MFIIVRPLVNLFVLVKPFSAPDCKDHKLLVTHQERKGSRKTIALVI